MEHSIIGALTVTIGSFGNITDPSGKAQISPVNLKFLKYSRKPSEKSEFSLKYSISSSLKLRFLT